MDDAEWLARAGTSLGSWCFRSDLVATSEYVEKKNWQNVKGLGYTVLFPVCFPRVLCFIGCLIEVISDKAHVTSSMPIVIVHVP